MPNREKTENKMVRGFAAWRPVTQIEARRGAAAKPHGSLRHPFSSVLLEEKDVNQITINSIGKKYDFIHEQSIQTFSVSP